MDYFKPQRCLFYMQHVFCANDGWITLNPSEYCETTKTACSYLTGQDEDHVIVRLFCFF